MGHYTLWIKWLFLTQYMYVTTDVKTGSTYRYLPHDIQQGQMPSPAPETSSPAADTAQGTALQKRSGEVWLNTNQQQRQPTASGLIHRSTASWGTQWHHPTLGRSRSEYHIPVWDLPVQAINWSKFRKGHKGGHGLERLPCKEKLRTLGFFGPQTRRLWGELMAACCCRLGCYPENRTRLLSEVQRRRTKELKKTKTPVTPALIHRNILWTTGCPLA